MARCPALNFTRPRLSPAPLPLGARPQCTPEQYNQLALDIRDAYNAGDLEAPAMLRLAFHTTTIGSAFAHGAGSNGGWIQYDEDRLAPGNAGLEDGVAALLQLRRAKCPGITAADLFTFAGSLGAELAGGPPVAWHPGARRRGTGRVRGARGARGRGR